MTHASARTLRRCLREPIPEIEVASKLLTAAVDAHLAGDRVEVVAESLWGKQGEYAVRGPFDPDPPVQRVAKARMPDLTLQRQLHTEGGYYCRFCGIPVVRREVREFFRRSYPEAKLWGSKNIEQHAAFQCMWAQYDHVIPHARGGANDSTNLIVACAPCNYGRMQYTLSEAGLEDPRRLPARVGSWRGLEKVLSPQRPE